LAQQLAFQNPRRCRRVVLVSTATGWMMVPASPRILSHMVTPRRYRDRTYAQSIAAELYGGQMRDDPARAKELLNGRAPVTSGRGYYLQLLGAMGWTSLPFLPLIRQKTLILTGDDDPIIRLVNARMMHRLLPDSTLHVFHDGHLGLVTLADDLGPRVSRFLLEP
jgi:pimeloyl-ACP methyl ester carboxylesterase